ncbi:uncharacterized protein FSUBG_12105 [Fusarium subglutinans]|uniref:Uncharacterized protein n=1 Tax=Gibberella subglutinans TaxID=42677 RepID=A0A8H5LA41_GIBSU|nr:uncharacterized protein FSUBG_12105 [Fusarium subglutinans]KAF5586595.1 hypothetical protein FSUBG_12105 [Fusarium subglutinans]
MAPKTLTSLPSEIRQQIFRECLEVDGGYVYDVQTDKLTNADGNAIDLSLLYTCRSIANDTRAMPLAVNTIRFSTVFRQDWCNLAGCFALAATTHYVLEQDFVFHLAHFITHEMYAELDLVCPGFQEKLEIALGDHERWIHENNDPGYFFQTATLLAKRPAVCSMVRQFLKRVDLFKMNGPFLGRLDFRLLHTEADANVCSVLAERKKRPEWAQGELRDATGHCLKLISEAQPDEFATYVYKSLPHWIGSRPAEDFINLRFNLWDIPSQERVAQMLELFEIGAFVWDLPATWYYAPLSFYDQVGKGVPQDRRSPEFEKPDNLLEHFTSRCREKLRFSATAAAIRFLQRLPISQRMQIRKIVLHEDLPSVNLPSRHTQGLIPFLKENPLLRAERHASVLGCVLSQRPYNIIADMDGDENMLPSAEMLHRDFEASIHYWLLDAFAVVDSGVNTSCFTFVLEAGQHSEYCADLFQKFIQTEISKSKAWKICLDTGLLASLRPWIRDDNAIRYAKDPRFEKLVDLLVNQTSSLRCDFNPGVLLDVDALVEDAKVRHGENILDKWVSKQDLGAITFPHDLYQDIMVAPNWEFQTRQEYIESRGMNTNAEDS